MTVWLLRIALAVILSPIANAAALAQQPPAAERVFRLAVLRDNDRTLRLEWTISPGNYLYRDKIVVTRSDGLPVEIDTPPGETNDDPTFGHTEVYHRTAYALVRTPTSAPGRTLAVSYQGCAERGICYPPLTRMIELASLNVIDPTKTARQKPSPSDEWTVSEPDNSNVDTPRAAADRDVLKGSWPSTVFSFLGFGLLLAFTPCMFPMIPILSGILAQSGERLTARRGAALSIVYVLAMATAYAALGLAVAWSGQNLQAASQTPLAIGMMSAIFVALALSLFGLYDLQLPQAWQSRLSGAGMGRGGSILGAGVMGFGSALVVGPCVTPPLAAALVYVAQTADVARGAAALFALGLGMGVPLIAYGTFGAGVIPKPGPWLSVIKHVFGFVFVGMAIWILSRVIPHWTTQLLAGSFFAAAGVALTLTFLRRRRPGDGWSGEILVVGMIAAIPASFAAILALDGSSGGLHEMLGLSASRAEQMPRSRPFERVTTTEALDLAIEKAGHEGKPVVLEFTADWCVECQILDRTVFTNPEVVRRLGELRLIKADATDYNEDARSLMSRFDVVGPPTIIFMKSQAVSEVPDTRIIGPVDARTFLTRLDRLHPATSLRKFGE